MTEILPVLSKEDLPRATADHIKRACKPEVWNEALFQMLKVSSEKNTPHYQYLRESFFEETSNYSKIQDEKLINFLPSSGQFNVSTISENAIDELVLLLATTCNDFKNFHETVSRISSFKLSQKGYSAAQSKLYERGFYISQGELLINQTLTNR